MDCYEEYYNIKKVLFSGNAAEFMKESEETSLPVYSFTNGKITDTYLIFATDFETLSPPYAFLSVDIVDGGLVEYVEISDNFIKLNRSNNIEVEETIESRYLKSFIEIRPYVFNEIKDFKIRKLINEYTEILNEIVLNYPYYTIIAHTFLKWFNSLK